MNSVSAIVGVYIILVSLIGFIQMGYDKRQAKRGFWRVPEKSLFLIAAFGGALGILLGMKLFHHKTMHKSFTLGIPALLALNIAVVGRIIFK